MSGSDSTELPSVKLFKSGDFFYVSDSSSTGKSDAGVQSALEYELAQYQAEKKVSRTDNPLDFWNVNEHRFKTMAKLACKYHRITATSVPSERLFSKAGNIVTNRHSSLAPKTIDCLCFLNNNL